MTEHVANVARAVFGAERYIPAARPSMGAEDFAFYLEQVSGCFFMIGVEPADVAGYPNLHSDRYDFTDAALAVAMRMFVELAMRFER
jgi:hippurate hydrolase